MQLESTPSQSLDFVIVISSLSDLLAECMRMTMLTLMTDGAHSTHTTVGLVCVGHRMGVARCKPRANMAARTRAPRDSASGSPLRLHHSTLDPLELRNPIKGC